MPTFDRVDADPLREIPTGPYQSPQTPEKSDAYLSGLAEIADQSAPFDEPPAYLDGLAEETPPEPLGLIEGASRALQRAGAGLKQVPIAAGEAFAKSFGMPARMIARAQGIDLAPPIGTALSPEAQQIYRDAPALAAARAVEVNSILAGMDQQRVRESPALAKSAIANGFNPTAFRWWYENGIEIAPQIASQVAAGVLTGGSSAGVRAFAFGATGAAPVAADAYYDATSRGKSEITALTEAGLIGASNTVLEAIPGAEILLGNPATRKVFGKVMQSRFADFALSTAGAATAEGATEFAQEVSADVIRAVAEADPEAFRDWQVRYPAAALLGAGAGGVVGGAARTLEAASGNRPFGMPNLGDSEPAKEQPQPKVEPKKPTVTKQTPQEPQQTPPAGPTAVPQEGPATAPPTSPQGQQQPAAGQYDAVIASLWERAPTVAYDLGRRYAEQGKISRKQYAEAAAEAKGFGVDLPRFERGNAAEASAFVEQVMRFDRARQAQATEQADQPARQGPTGFTTDDGDFEVNGQSTTQIAADGQQPGTPSTFTVYAPNNKMIGKIGEIFGQDMAKRQPTFEVDRSMTRPLARIRHLGGKDFTAKRIDEFTVSDTPTIGSHPIQVWMNEDGSVRQVVAGSPIKATSIAQRAPAQQAEATPQESTPATEAPAAESQPTEPATTEPPAAPAVPVATTATPAINPAPTATPKPFKLPTDLQGASPRYSYGQKQFRLDFASDLDRSLYILAQPKPSKRDADFLSAVTAHTGMSEAEARKAGAAIRNSIKTLARDAEPGSLTIEPSDFNRPAAIASTPTADNTTPVVTTTPEVPATPQPVEDQTNGQESFQQGRQVAEDEQGRQGQRQEGLLAPEAAAPAEPATSIPPVAAEPEQAAPVEPEPAEQDQGNFDWVDSDPEVKFDPRLAAAIKSGTRQTTIPGFARDAAIASARDKLFRPYFDEFSGVLTEEAIAEDRDAFFKDIPAAARSEIQSMLDDEIEKEDFDDSIPDRAKDASYDAGELLDSSFLPDVITGQQPSTSTKQQIDTARQAAFDAAMIDAMKAVRAFDAARIDGVLQERKNAQDYENRFEVVDTVVLKIPDNLRRYVSDADKPARDAWFDARAKELGYDPKVLDDAWREWKDTMDADYPATPLDPEDTSTAPPVSEPPSANPAFRDWRWKKKYKNGGTIYPNKVGTKFTDAQVSEIVTWARAHGWNVGESGPTMIEITDSSGNALDLTFNGAAGVKAEAEEAKAAQLAAEKAQKKEDAENQANSRESAGWIKERFGSGIGAYNRNSLSDFLEGVSKKFEGLTSPAWVEPLTSMGLIDKTQAQGVDWKKLKRLYEASKTADTLPEVVTTKATPVEPPKVEDIQFRRETLGGEVGATSKQEKYDRIGELRQKRFEIEQRKKPWTQKLAGLRSNAYKKKASIQEQINEFDRLIEPIAKEMRNLEDQIDLQIIEDRFEAAETPELKLYYAAEQAKKKIALLPKDRWGNSTSEADYKRLSADADKHYDQLYKMAESMVDANSFNPEERSFLAKEAIHRWSGDPKLPISKFVDDAISSIYISRSSQMQREVDASPSLPDDRKQAYYDEISEAAKRKDWRKIADDIKRRSEEEAAVLRAQKAEIDAKEREVAAEKRKAERAQEIRDRRRAATTALAVARYFDELPGRAKSIKGTKGKVRVAAPEVDEKTGKRELGDEVDAEIIGKWAITEVPNELGKARKGKETPTSFSLTHIATGLGFGIYENTPAAIRSFMQHAADMGIDLQSVDDKGGGFPYAPARKARESWNNKSFNDDAEGEAKALALVKIAPTRTKADYVMNSFELGVFGGKGLSSVGYEKIKMMAKEIPQFSENPVFTTDPQHEAIQYEWPGGKMTFHAALFNLGDLDLSEYKTIGINIEDLGIEPTNRAETIAEQMKNAGFQNVRVKDGAVTGSWRDTKVTVSGQGNQWSVTGKAGKQAQARAEGVLSSMGLFDGTPGTVIGAPEPDYVAPKLHKYGLYFPESVDAADKMVADIDKILKKDIDAPTKGIQIAKLIENDPQGVDQIALLHLAKQDPDLARWLASRESLYRDIPPSLMVRLEPVVRSLPEREDAGLLAYPQSVFDQEWPAVAKAINDAQPVNRMAAAAEKVVNQPLKSVRLAMLQRIADEMPDHFIEAFDRGRVIPNSLILDWGDIVRELKYNSAGESVSNVSLPAAASDYAAYPDERPPFYELSVDNATVTTESDDGPKLTKKEKASALADYSVDKTVTKKAPETKYGKFVVGEVTADLKRSKPRFGLPSIIEHLADRMHTMIIRDRANTSNRWPAHYQPTSVSIEGSWKSHLIRDRFAPSQLDFHELGHALSAIVRSRAPSFRSKLAKALKALTKMPGSMASAKTPEEGFAEFIRRSIVTPNSLPRDIKATIEKSLDRIDTKIMGQIRDAHRAYAIHRSRPLFDQDSANRNDRGVGTKLRKIVRETIGKALLAGIGGSTVIFRKNRDVFNAIATGSTTLDALTRDDYLLPTGLIVAPLREMLSPDYRQRARVARESLGAILNTNMDIEAAHQAMAVHSRQEIDRMIHGATVGQEGVRVVNDVPTSNIDEKGNIAGMEDKPEFKVVERRDDGKLVSVGELSALELGVMAEAGLPIPKPAAQGEYLQITDESFAKIKADIPTDKWEAFQSYGFNKAEVARIQQYARQKQRYQYPGMLDGKKLNQMKRSVAKAEAENPEWLSVFKRVENYYRGLLVTSVISGEITPSQAVKIAQKYENYWGMERQLPGQGVVTSGSIRGNPSSRIGKSKGGSTYYQVPLDKQIAAQTSRHVDAYYTARYIGTHARYVGHFASDMTLPFKARADISNSFVPLRLSNEVAATISEQQEREIIADGINRNALAESGFPSQLLSKLKSKDFQPVMEEAGLQYTDPDDVIVTNPLRKVWQKSERPNARYFVSSFRAGKRQYWQVNDPVEFDMIAGVPATSWQKGIAWIAGMLRGPSQAFSRALTRSLVFTLFNTLGRDPNTARQNSAGAESFVPYAHLAIGIIGRLRHMRGISTVPEQDRLVLGDSEVATRTLLANTGDVHGGVVNSIRDSFWEMLKEGLVIDDFSSRSWSQIGQQVPGIVASGITKPVDIANWLTGGYYLSTLGENLTREGAQRLSLMRGDTPERARMNRDKITGNFGQRPGSPAAAELYGATSFLNATVQSSYQGFEGLYHPDPKIRAINAAKLVVASIQGAALAALGYLIVLATSKDEEDRDQKLKFLRERPEFDRLRYMSIGGVRLPFGNGPIAGMFGFGYNAIEGMLIEQPVASQELAMGVLGNILDTPEIADFIQPQIKSAIEVINNRAYYFDRDIVPGWMADKYAHVPELQAYDSTPEAYKSMAKFFADIPGTGRWLAVSPLKIQHVIRNSFSREIDSLITAVDKAAQGIPVDMSDYPLFGRAFIREPRGWSSHSVDSLSDINDEYLTLRDRAKELSTYTTGDQELNNLRRQISELTPAHNTMLRIERLYDAVKLRRRAGDYENARELERRMTQEASMYFDMMSKLKRE